MSSYDFTDYDPEDENATLDVSFYMQRTVISTLDGGFVFAGITEEIHLSNGTHSIIVQLTLTKTDAQGNIQWTKSYGDEDTFYVVYDLLQAHDGGFAIVGYRATQSEEENAAKVLLIKTAVNGEIGLAMTGSTPNTVTLYRGDSDPYWNFVRVRIWVIK
jgi:hypothetical protein